MEEKKTLNIKGILNKSSKQTNIFDNKVTEINTDGWHNYNEHPKQFSKILIYNNKTTDFHYIETSHLDVNLQEHDRWIYFDDMLRMTNYVAPKIQTCPIYYIDVNIFTNKEVTTLIKQLYNFDNRTTFIMNIDTSLGKFNIDSGIKNIVDIIIKDDKIIKNKNNLSNEKIQSLLMFTLNK